MLRFEKNNHRSLFALIFLCLVSCSILSANSIDDIDTYTHSSIRMCTINATVGNCTNFNDSATGEVLVSVFVEGTGIATIDIDGTNAQTIDLDQVGCATYVQFILPSDGASHTINTDCGATETVVFPDACPNSPCMSTSGTIGGKVFLDFNLDGAQTDAEYGFQNILVSIYSQNNILITTTTTNNAGNWSVSGLTDAEELRVEFTNIPTGYTPGNPENSNVGSEVQFVEVPTCNVNFALGDPDSYCQDNPYLLTNCYINGDNSGNEDAIVGIPFQATATGGSGSGSESEYLATVSEIGSTWGLAWDANNDLLYSAAFLKRHANWGPQGLGGIYVTDFGAAQAGGFASAMGNSMDFINLDNLGINTCDENIFVRDFGPTATDESHDDQAFDFVGKCGLGDMDISSDGTTLYVTNLAMNEIVGIDIATQSITSIHTIPDPGCTAASDWHIYAVNFYKGKLIVGGICTAESTQIDADMQAIVYEFDATAPTVTTADVILSIPLDYTKGTAGGGLGTKWNPWVSDFTQMQVPGSLDNNDNYAHPQPVLSNIEVDIYGGLILTFMDRTGHQLGLNNMEPYTTTDDEIGQVWAGGDVLKVYNNNGTWLPERDGVVGYDQGCGAGDMNQLNANGNNQGPCGGEFFCGDTAPGFHTETVMGGSVYFPVEDNVVVSLVDPTGFHAGGLQWLDNEDGEQVKGYTVYQQTNDGSTQAFFHKGNGLGDVELTCEGSPLQIGNVVWYDSDMDGVQDPGEDLIEGAIVELWEDTDGDGIGDVLVGTATTDADGEYYFGGSSDTNLLSGSLMPFTNYEIRVDIASVQTWHDSQYPTYPITVSFNDVDSDATDPMNGGGNDTLDDIRDSDGQLSADETYSSHSFTTGGIGSAIYNYDFGFFEDFLYDYGDLPDGTTGTGNLDYQTSIANGGPGHIIIDGLYLGAQVDDEDDGQGDIEAMGDDTTDGTDDEDGIGFDSNLDIVPGATIIIPLDVTNTTGNTAHVEMWIDWNGDGDFDDPNEMIANLDDSTTPFPNNLTIIVPTDVATDTDLGVRIRLSNEDDMTPLGIVSSGEVEDYLIQVNCAEEVCMPMVIQINR